MKKLIRMKLFISIFIILGSVTVYAQKSGSRVKLDKDITDQVNQAISCNMNQDCIDQNIISDTDNIVDLYEAIDKFTGDYIQSRTSIHVNYWDYVRLKEETDYNEFDFLNQEYLILKGLGDCLYEREVNNPILATKIDKLIPIHTNFFFGDDKQNFENLMLKNYYSCALKRENSKLKAEKLEKICLEEAHEHYFYYDLKSQLSEFFKTYESSETLEEHLKSFEKCHKHDQTQMWGCYSDLNTKLLTLKAGHLVNSISKNDIPISNSKEKLKDYRKCVTDTHANNQYSKYCKELLVESVSYDILEKTPEDKKDILNKVVIPRCSKNSGLKSEIDCFREIKIALKTDKNASTEMFYHNLDKIEDIWKRSSSKSTKSNQRFNYELMIDDMGNEDKEVKRDFVKSVPGLTSVEMACINDYTGSGYSDMNRYLWSSGSKYSNTEKYPSQVACAMSGLKKISKSYSKNKKNYKKTVFRGMGSAPFTDRFKNDGDCIVFTGFTSTSYKKNSAFGGEFELEIENCEQGSEDAGAMVEPLSEYDNEKEVLFLPGTRFRVVKPVDGQGNVKLQCITEEEHQRTKMDCH